MAGYFHSPKMNYGRRSKKPLGVLIRKLSTGFDDVKGYFPDSDEELSTSERSQEFGTPECSMDKSHNASNCVSISSGEKLCVEERLDYKKERDGQEIYAVRGDTDSNIKLLQLSTAYDENFDLQRSISQSHASDKADISSSNRCSQKTPEKQLGERGNGTIGCGRSELQLGSNKRRSRVAKDVLGSGLPSSSSTKRCRFSDRGANAVNAIAGELSTSGKKNLPDGVSTMKIAECSGQSTPKRQSVVSLRRSHGKSYKDMVEEELTNDYFNQEVRVVESNKNQKTMQVLGKQKRKMTRSVKDTAVSTDGLLDDGVSFDKSENAEAEMPTRYIIIERNNPRIVKKSAKRRTIRRNLDDEKSEKRSLKKQGQRFPRAKSSLKTSSIVPCTYLSTDGEPSPQRENLNLKNKRKRQNQRKNLSLGNGHESVHFDAEQVQRGKRAKEGRKSSYTKGDGIEFEKRLSRGERLMMFGKEQSRDSDLRKNKKRLTPLRRKSEEVFNELNNESEESVNDSRYNRLENEKRVKRMSSTKPASLQNTPAIDREVEAQVNQNLLETMESGPKSTKRRVKRISYPRRRKSKSASASGTAQGCESGDNFKDSNEDEEERSCEDFAVAHYSKTPLSLLPKERMKGAMTETPKSRSMLSLISSHVTSWVGPSPVRMDRINLRATPVSGEKRKRRSYSALNGINTLPGGIDSEQERELDSGNPETKEVGDVREDESMETVDEKPPKPVVKKRRKNCRIAYPRSKRRADKVKVCGLEISSSKFEEIVNEGDSKEGIRVGKRKRMKPVRNWILKERVQYERTDSGFSLKSPVVSAEDETGKIAMNRKKNSSETQRKPRKVKATNRKMYENVPPTMMVRDDEDKLISTHVIVTPAMIHLDAPGKLPDGREFHSILLHRFFEQRFFNAGVFALLPNAEKGHQFVQNDTLLFRVINGEVDFMIENEVRRLGPDCHFFVPSGNAYNIKNAASEEATIFYVQIKG